MLLDMLYAAVYDIQCYTCYLMLYVLYDVIYMLYADTYAINPLKANDKS